MNEFRTTLRVVSLNDRGLPDAKGPLAVGDLCLAPSRTDPEAYDEWVWTGDSLEWQRLGSIDRSLMVREDERTMRQQRVERVKQYFKVRELKRLKNDELINRLERGEHLSREELRELSVIGYSL